MRYLLIVGLVLALFSVGQSEAVARQWKPTPVEILEYYLVIDHFRYDGDIVSIMWAAPSTIDMPAGEERDQLRSTLGQFLTIGILHSRFTESGEFQAKKPAGIALLETEQEESREPLNDLPPLVSAMAVMQTQTLASVTGVYVGEGLETFFFDGSGIDECNPGKFWIRYDGERYEYETPIPGCK